MGAYLVFPGERLQHLLVEKIGILQRRDFLFEKRSRHQKFSCKQVGLFLVVVLRRWLCDKHGVWVGIFKRFPDKYLHQQLGLKQLGVTGHSQLWAKV